MNSTPLSPAVLSFSPNGGNTTPDAVDALFPDRDTFYKLAGLALDFWEHKAEAGFGAVTGGLQALVPAGWALPGEQTPELLGLYFDEGQKAYFDLGRGAVLDIAGVMKVFGGLEMMATGAGLGIVGLGTAGAGIGLIGLAGGAAIEVIGVVTVADGAADTIVGTIILTRSGVYILRDRFNLIRYGGKAKSFSGRKSGHKASKPKHKFEELWQINDPNIRAGAEQWLIEHCPTCDWNKISGISVTNRKFDWRVIKFIDWHLKQFGRMPPTLFQ